MRRRLAAGLVLVAVSLAVSPAISPAGAKTSSHSAMRSLETGILAQVNTLRRSHGLVPLRLSAKLSSAARQHSAEMASRGYFGHNSVDGSHFDRRIARFYPMGSHRYWSVGENLLWSSPDVDAPSAIKMWMGSPEHRANLLNRSWREVGLSAVHSDSAPGTYHGLGVTIVTADFGARQK
jgi:uncharacterized protein YkwD